MVQLARFTDRDTPGPIWLGVVDGDRALPITAVVDADGGQAELLRWAMARGRPGPDGDWVPLDSVSLRSPVPFPPSIRDFYAFEAHVATAREARGLAMDPDWYQLPVFYFSNPAAVLGPDDPVHAPRDCAELDYELEVAAVVGVRCSDVPAEQWLDVVAGFTVMNDWSARDLQRREMRHGLGPAKGKDFATSLGPVLVTPDELPDVRSGRPRARMTAAVDGVEWSRGDLGDLQFTWGELIAHASRDAELRPGDVIGSGTVGTGCILELSATHGGERYPWLAPGATVSCEVAGLGVLTNPIVARPDAGGGRGDGAPTSRPRSG
ncbi:MAG: fumarylacetoacetase [Acidimicrobiales bacterium]|nr:fumarylacetoacetase [Acidimicrobiales bacterium]